MAKNIQLDANGFRKFGFRDKIAYCAGDFGCNMSFALKSSMTIFWTQFMGVDSIAMAAMLLLVQIWDAINDPVIGSVVDADRHQYKRNKFLQYIWVGSIGLLVAGAFCFIPWPTAPTIVKYILFVAGYVLWDAFYTIANVPYGSRLSLISSDPVERAQLSTWRSLGSQAGNIVTMIALPLLIYDASQNMVGERMFLIALLMGVIGFFCFQFMIRNTEIRVNKEINVNEEAPKFNFLEAMGNFLRNRAAVGASLMAVFMFIGLYGSNTAITVLFQSYFKNVQISGFVGTLSMLGVFVFMPFVAPIVKRFGKKEAVAAGMILYSFAYVLMLILPVTPDGKGLAIYVGCQIIAALGNGINSCVTWSLMADAMDYEEWKFGTRHEGTTYAMYSFFRKTAQGIGPSLGLVLMTMVGYDESLKAAQTLETATNLRYYVPGILLFAGLMQLFCVSVIYNLDKKTMATIEKDLNERHKND